MVLTHCAMLVAENWSHKTTRKPQASIHWGVAKLSDEQLDEELRSAGEPERESHRKTWRRGWESTGVCKKYLI